MIETILEKFEQFEVRQEELRAEQQQTMRQVFVALFDAVPEVKAIAWNQYTPGFNDGDPCVFSMTDICFITDDIAEIDEDDLESPDDYECFDGNDITKKVARLMASNEDVFLSLYGNDNSIFVTRDKTIIQEYECGW